MQSHPCSLVLPASACITPVSADCHLHAEEGVSYTRLLQMLLLLLLVMRVLICRCRINRLAHTVWLVRPQVAAGVAASA
jgi:hypothetical protein